MADVDVASLGLTVNAQTVAQATQALNQFSQAGNNAAATAVRFNTATGQFQQGVTGTVGQFQRAQAAMAGWNQVTQQGAVVAPQLTAAVRGAGQAAAISAQQWQFLGFQLNDIITGLASGQSPFTILAQQGGQVYQSLAGPQGVVASLRDIGRYVGSLITPVSVLGTAFVIAGGLAVRAWAEFTSVNRELNITLQGTGRILGLNADSFRTYIETAATAGNINQKTAIELGAALARTGRLSVENIQRLVTLSRDFGTTFGGSAKEVQKGLTDAFASGFEGIQRLNAQYNFLDARTQRVVQGLILQGRHQEAIALAADKLQASLVRTDDNLSQAAGLWERIKNSISAADLALGSMLDKASRPQPAAQVAQLAQQVERLRDASTSRGGIGTIENPAQPGGPVYTDPLNRPSTVASTTPLPPGRPTELQTAEQRLNSLQAGMAEAARVRGLEERSKAETAEIVRRSGEIQSQIKTYNPGADRLREMEDVAKGMEEALKPGNERLRSAIVNTTEFGEALSVVRNQTNTLRDAQGNYITDTDRAIEQGGIQIKQINDRTTAGQAELAAEQVRAGNRGRAITQTQDLVEQETARTRVILEAKKAIDDQNLAMDREAALHVQVGKQREVSTQLLAIELQYRNANRTLSREELAAFAQRIAREYDLNVVRTQANALYTASIKPAEDYNNVIKAANILASQGVGSLQQYAGAIDDARIKMLQASGTARGGLEAGLLGIARDYGNVSKSMENLVTSSAGTISSALTEIATGTKTAKEGFREMAASVVRNILEMTIRMTIMAPIARGLSSLLGGGNFLSGLVGLGGGGIAVPGNLGGGTYPTVDSFSGLFASGGFLGAGKWGIAGERGPEIVKGPAEIVPSTGGAVQLNYAPVLDMRGATGVTEGQVQSMLAQQFVVMKQTLPSMMRDAQQRRRI